MHAPFFGGFVSWEPNLPERLHELSPRGQEKQKRGCQACIFLLMVSLYWGYVGVILFVYIGVILGLDGVILGLDGVKLGLYWGYVGIYWGYIGVIFWLDGGYIRVYWGYIRLVGDPGT